MKTTKISEKILGVLAGATCEGNELILHGMLDRDVYKRVAKVIEAAGGKWNRKAGAHVFEGSAAEAIEPVILTGVIVKPGDLGQFDTPQPLAEKLVAMAGVEAGMLVLEPSAGVGRILTEIQHAGARAMYCEIDEKRYAKIRTEIQAINGRCADFLTLDPSRAAKVDAVVMNPPFAPAQADIDHVLHAAKFLKPGGRLVSVMSAGILFRTNRKTREFVAYVEARNGKFTRLPEGSFASSGTHVNTCTVMFNERSDQ